MALSREINKVLVDLKANFGSYLKDAGNVSITADIWSEKGLTSSYMGITAHFSPKDHYHHRVMLQWWEWHLPTLRKGSLKVIEEVLTEWKIPYSKVSPILTDNGSNMVAAFCAHFQNEGKDEEEDEWRWCWFWFWWMCERRQVEHELVLGTVFKRVSCFSHTLQLVVNIFQQCKSFKNLLKSAHSVVRKV